MNGNDKINSLWNGLTADGTLAEIMRVMSDDELNEIAERIARKLGIDFEEIDEPVEDRLTIHERMCELTL